ncbi:UPF0182 family protein [Longispora sp. NPDC051575]|uniref:UPF0182 family membrane protein n=1 Tax=Longispora sp. NPDC051575 TaxID=3154943 RepID=UPI0034416A98
MRTPIPRVSRRGRRVMGTLAVLLVLMTVLSWAVDAYTDWLWFAEVKYTGVFREVLTTRILMFVAFGAAVAALVAGNLFLAFRLRPLLPSGSPAQRALDRYRMAITPRIRWVLGGTAVLLGVLTGLSAQGHWQQWLLFRNGGKFDVVDPQFKVDLGFYVFEYPFWRYLLGVAFTTTVLCLLGALALHYLYGAVRLEGAGDRMSAAARAHLTALVAVFVLLKAVAYWLDRRGMLLGQNQSTDVAGAGYTDINALLPAKEILAWISIVVAIAILVFSNAVMRNLVWPGAALALLGLAAVAVGGIYPAAVQAIEVKPNSREKEADYIKRAIDSTRYGYGLDKVERKQYPITSITPPADLTKDPSITNVRLLDPAVVSETYTQLQQVRGFYDFGAKLDIDRYTVDGKTQDYVVGVREINPANLRDNQTNWQNRHTVFTHGYGFVGAPANKVVCGGQPYFSSGFLDDGKNSQSSECADRGDKIPTEQPRVYYGELMSDYSIVGKETGGKDIEFDRPTAGEQQTNFTYAGAGGVKVDNLLRKTLFALKYREANFLLSSALNDNSKVLYVRNPRDRVEKAAPFLTVDGDPYPAVVSGRIVWIVDGYTTSSTVPYSQKVNLRDAARDAQTGAGTVAQARQDVNYMRNSVKATVDAYDGTVSLYAWDEKDPILKAWNKAFGGDVVKPKSAISPELMDHLRYPEDLFKVQRDLLTKFHVSDPKQYFSGDDFWQVPDDPTHDAKSPQPAYYLLTQFPGQDKQTFQLTASMTPRNRPNLASMMSASYTADGTPKIDLLDLGSVQGLLGPGLAQQKLLSSPEVNRDIALFNTPPSKLIKGNLLTLPIGGGLLYVEPLYIQGGTGGTNYPQAKKVLVTYGQGDYVGYGDTLEAALDQIVRQAAAGRPTTPPTTTPPTTGTPTPTPTPVPPSGDLAAAVAKMQAAIDEVRRTQASGDFEAYGKALKNLDTAIKEFEEAQKKTPAAR